MTNVRRSASSVALVATLLAVAGCATQEGSEARLQEQPTPTPIPTPIVSTNPTYTVERGEVVKQIEFRGVIAPVVEQELFFRTDGRVRNVFVQQGDLVTAGQVMADLEIDALEQQLAFDLLALRRAEINLEIARLELERVTKLSPNSHEAAIKGFQVELAEIALQETSLGMQDLEGAIADAQIIAPFDGQVLRFSLSEGREVEAFRPVASVADPSELEVRADLTDRQMGDLAEGMPVTLSLADRPGQEIQGSIRRLPPPYGSGSEQDESTRVRLALAPDEAGIEQGDRVRLIVVVERREDVLWLPPQAIRIFSGRKFVLVRQEAGQQRVDVQLGLQTENRVEIEAGLTEGQVVFGE